MDVCLISGATRRSIKISKDESKYELYTPVFDLAHVFPQLLVIKINYRVLDEEHIIDLIQDGKEYIKALRGIIKSGSLTPSKSMYIIFSGSLEYQNVLDKLVEQTPQCIVCGQYYDSFPSQKSALLHMSGCSTV